MSRKFPSLILVPISLILPIYIFSITEYFILNGIKAHKEKAEEQVIKEINKKKIESAKRGNLPIFGPKLIRQHFLQTKFYPIGSLPRQGSFYCDEGYGLIEFKTDRFGLRNEDSDWDAAKSSHEITYVVGDSFVQGACVEKESTLTHHMKATSGRKVFNIGSGGNGPHEYIAILNNFIEPIISKLANTKPKIVVVFYSNDNEHRRDQFLELASNSKPVTKITDDQRIIPIRKYSETYYSRINANYPLSTAGVIEKLKKRTKNQESMPNGLKHSPAYKIITLESLRRRAERLTQRREEEPLTDTPTFIAIQRLRKICEKNCKPYIAWVPPSNKWARGEASKNYMQAIKKQASINGIKFIDGAKVIDTNNNAHYAPNGPHLSREGYQRLAQHLLRESQ